MIDRPLFLAVTALIVIGMVFSYSLSAYTVLLYNTHPYHFFLRQFVAGMAGIVIMWALARQNPEKIVTPVGFTLLLASALLTKRSAVRRGGYVWVRYLWHRWSFSRSVSSFFWRGAFRAKFCRAIWREGAGSDIR